MLLLPAVQKTASLEEALLPQKLPIARLSSLNLEPKRLPFRLRSSLRKQPVSWILSVISLCCLSNSGATEGYAASIELISRWPLFWASLESKTNEPTCNLVARLILE